MGIDAVIVACQPTSDASRALQRLAFMLRMRGVGVVCEELGAEKTTLETRVQILKDARVYVAVLDSTAPEGNEARKAFLEWLDDTHSLSNRSVVLVSAKGPHERTSLPERLRSEPITRMDLPLGLHRVAARLGYAPFMGLSPGDRRVIEFAPLDDVPTDSDSLGREALLAHVARMIRGASRGMTISVEGPWGAGKSSFIAQLAKQLSNPTDADDSSFRIVEFNPWRLDKTDTVWASFAIAFYEQVYRFKILDLFKPDRYLGAIHDLWGRASLAWRRYDVRSNFPSFLRLVALGSLIVGAIILLAAPAQVRDFVGDHLGKLAGHGATEKSTATGDDSEWNLVTRLFAVFLAFPSLRAAGRVLWSMKPVEILKDMADKAKGPDYEGKRPFIQQFQEDFAKVRASFDHCRVAVMIDDIDRCEPAVAAELFQAMNLMIPEDSDMAFVIAMDREKVAAGLAARAEKILPILAGSREGAHGFDGARALDYGFQVLEKSIQLQVRLPPARSENLRSLIPPKALSQLYASTELGDIIERVAPVLGNNPRRVKQFLNVMSLNMHLVGGDEPWATRAQLAKLLAITLRWPRLVPDIAEEPALLAELEELAVDADSRLASEGALARWAREEDLLALLAHDIDLDVNRERAARLSFLGVDIRRLLGARRASPIATMASAATGRG